VVESGGGAPAATRTPTSADTSAPELPETPQQPPQHHAASRWRRSSFQPRKRRRCAAEECPAGIRAEAARSSCAVQATPPATRRPSSLRQPSQALRQHQDGLGGVQQLAAGYGVRVFGHSLPALHKRGYDQAGQGRSKLPARPILRCPENRTLLGNCVRAAAQVKSARCSENAGCSV